MSETEERLIVAIDGPSGSGKSSASRGVASRLGLRYLDTGAMYRAVAWLVLSSEVDPSDVEAVTKLVGEASVEINMDPSARCVRINGLDVTEAIRTPQVSAKVSSVSTVLGVRDDLIARQRALIAQAEQGIVVEGRDITTVVAPNAQVRVLLVADPAARVARRQAELGDLVDVDEVTDQVIRRDRDDATVADFGSAAPGVTVVDSTDLSLDEVVDVICRLAKDHQR